jgi:hypothetical protein
MTPPAVEASQEVLLPGTSEMIKYLHVDRYFSEWYWCFDETNTFKPKRIFDSANILLLNSYNTKSYITQGKRLVKEAE